MEDWCIVWWMLRADECGLPQRSSRIFIIGCHSNVLRAAGLESLPYPERHQQKAELSNFLENTGVMSRVDLLSQKMRDNLQKYEEMVRTGWAEVGKQQLCVVDLSRDPAKRFGACLSIEQLGTVTTKSKYLWLFGDEDGKVAMPGRWLTVRERALSCGILPDSLLGMSDHAKIAALGCCTPPPLIGTVLKPIMNVWYDYEQWLFSVSLRPPCPGTCDWEEYPAEKNTVAAGAASHQHPHPLPHLIRKRKSIAPPMLAEASKTSHAGPLAGAQTLITNFFRKRQPSDD